MALENVEEGYDERFVEPPDDEMICPICLLVMRDPVQAVTCGHCLCKTCHEKQRTQTAGPLKCLKCNERREEFSDDPKEKRRIHSLLVRCRIEQCDWTGELRNLENHLQSCQVDCTFSVVGCTWKAARSETDPHNHLKLITTMKLENDVLKRRNDSLKKENNQLNQGKEQLRINNNQLKEENSVLKEENADLKELNAEILGELEAQDQEWLHFNKSDVITEGKQAKSVKCSPTNQGAKVDTKQPDHFQSSPGLSKEDIEILGQQLIKTARCKDLTQMKALLQRGAPVNCVDGCGGTPLMLATLNADIDSVLLLLDWPSVNINAKNRSGRTALHFAAFYGNCIIINLLIEAGADANEKDYGGDTPLDDAQRRGHWDATCILFKRHT